MNSKKIFRKYEEKIPDLDFFNDLIKKSEIKEESLNQKIEQNHKNDILVVESDHSSKKEPQEKNILKRNRVNTNLDKSDNHPQKRKKLNKNINGNGKSQIELEKNET